MKEWRKLVCEWPFIGAVALVVAVIAIWSSANIFDTTKGVVLVFF
jgi:hypothetical protein